VPVPKIDGSYTDDNKKLGSDFQMDIPSPNSLAKSRCRFGGCPHCDSIHIYLDSETAGLEVKARLTQNCTIRHDSKLQPFISSPHILPLNGVSIP